MSAPGLAAVLGAAGLAVAAGPGAAGPAADGSAPYRTVVVFGDTQSLVDGPSPRGEPLRVRGKPEHAADYAAFGRMVDWVVAHRARENIDFVLHLGDIIDSGGHLPLRPACRGPDGCVRPEGDCNDAAGRCVEPLPPGCWERPRRPGCERCHCWSLDATSAEWHRFSHVWSRLERAEPPIPYAIVRGNHDNVGRPGQALDREGYVQHFGREHLGRLGPTSGYLETCPPCAGRRGSGCCHAGDAHAWRFRLGAQEVLVVGASYAPGPSQRRWLGEVLDRHSELPAIVITHSFIAGKHNQALLHEVVEPRARQVFMRAEGHLVVDRKDVRRVGGHEMLVFRFDRQHTPPPLNSALLLVRFYPGEDGIESVEALTFSPLGELPRALAPRLDRRPFRVPRAPPGG